VLVVEFELSIGLAFLDKVSLFRWLITRLVVELELLIRLAFLENASFLEWLITTCEKKSVIIIQLNLEFKVKFNKAMSS